MLPERQTSNIGERHGRAYHNKLTRKPATGRSDGVLPEQRLHLRADGRCVRTWLPERRCTSRVGYRFTE